MAARDPAVAALLARAARQPNWMPDPESWVWVTPAGQKQGFGPAWQESPGLANLLWLVLDMDVPPRIYEARRNILYTSLALQAATHARTICGLAEALSIRDFYKQISAPAAVPDTREGKAWRTSLMIFLERRLECGH